MAVFAPTPGTGAQDDPDDEQASQIADLQTRVAMLETVQAERSDNPDAIEATEIAELQTRVANLETAIAGGPSVTSSDQTVLYEANADTGWADWTEGYFGGFSNQFTDENGVLTAAAGGFTVLFAPYLTTSPDYILEAEIQLVPPSDGTPGTAFGSTIAGLAARYLLSSSFSDREGYLARTQGNTASIESASSGGLGSIAELTGDDLPDIQHGWHTYRLEVRGATIRFLIDDILLVEINDDRFTGFGEDGRVGILASLGPLEVRRFRVLAWGED
jgi:hypothetical protein